MYFLNIDKFLILIILVLISVSILTKKLDLFFKRDAFLVSALAIYFLIEIYFFQWEFFLVRFSTFVCLISLVRDRAKERNNSESE